MADKALTEAIRAARALVEDVIKAEGAARASRLRKGEAGLTRCPDCERNLEPTAGGEYPKHQVDGKGQCPGGGKRAVVKGGPQDPVKPENGAGEAVKLGKNEGCAPMAMSAKSRVPGLCKASEGPDTWNPGSDAAPKVRGSVLAVRKPITIPPKKMSPKGIRGAPAGMVQVSPSPSAKAEPMAKGPPPIPPAAIKHPKASPEGLPLVGTAIPPRVPPSVTGKIPAKLPGVAPAKLPGAGSLTPAAPLAPAPKGPRAPTMSSTKVPGIHKSELTKAWSPQNGNRGAQPAGHDPDGSSECPECKMERVPHKGATQDDHYEQCSIGKKLPAKKNKSEGKR